MVTLAGSFTVAMAVADAKPAASESLGRLKRPSTAAGFDTNRSAGKPTSRPTRSAPKRAVAKNGEIPSMRTRYSETFQRPDGSMRTEVSTVPLHYRAGGRWAKIDTSLMRTSNAATSSYENAAGDVAVSLPAKANGGVTVSQGSVAVTTKSVGVAASPIQVDGSDATYENVSPGVDQTYTVQDDGFEQNYVLASAAAPSSFRSTVTVPTGAVLRAGPGRAASVVGSNGTLIATLPAPAAYDSSRNIDTDTNNDVTYSITGTSPTYTVTTTLDRAWLTDSARVFPVRLDPSVNFGGGDDNTSCYVSNFAGSSCSHGSGTDNPTTFGATSSGAGLRRSYLRFNDLTSASSQVPADAVVSNATLSMSYVLSSGSASSLDTIVQRIDGDWDDTIDWDHQPNTSAFYQDRRTVTKPTSAGDTVTFNPTYLVAAWVRNEVPNQGLVIKAKDESTADLALRFQGFANPGRPVLTVDWRPQVGQKQNIGAYDHKLSDRIDLHVDYGTRNLVVNNTDETMSGPGQSIVVRRTYNSLTAATNTTGTFGQGWTMSGGVDAGLRINRSNVVFVNPGGAMTTFGRDFRYDIDSDTAYRKPFGMHAKLTKPDSTHYRLEDRQAKTRKTFTIAADGNTAWLSEVNDHQDGTGTKITYDSSGTPLRTTKVTDTTGTRSVNLSYTGNLATGMSESLGAGTTGARSWSYAYDSNNRLSNYTDAAGKITRYCYNTAGLLSRVITPRGINTGASCATASGTDVTDIAYDSAGAVTSVTYQNGSTANAITITFATSAAIARTSSGSSSGKTRFTDPYGKDTVYTFDEGDRITQTLNPLNNSSKSTYNINGDVTASVSPNNFTGGASDSSTTSSYDPATNNKTSTTLPTGSSVGATYNDTANSDLPDTTKDDRGKSTSYTRNSNGQSMTTTNGGIKVKVLNDGDDDPDSSGTIHCGPGTTAAYKGVVCETRDADYSTSSPTQHRTKYAYNSLNQLVSVTPAAPGSGRTTPPAQTFTYDDQFRIKTVTSGRNKTTTYTYDTLDRITRTTYNNGAYTNVSYDDDGNVLVQADYDTGGYLRDSETYTYDGFNRPATETKNGKPATTTTWDANSNLLTFTDDTGTTQYGYNSASQLTSTTLPSGDCTGFTPANPPTASSGCIIFDLNRDGARVSTTYPGNYARQATTYDKSGRVIEQKGTGQSSGSGATLFDFKYDFKAAGVDTNHIITRTDVVGANTTLTYDYTDQGRLKTATTKNSGGTVTNVRTYCYDDNANRTRRDSSANAGATCASSSLNSSWDGANQQLSGPDGANSSFTFDLDGNETGSATALPNASSTRASTWTDSDQTATVASNGAAAAGSTYLGSGQDTLLRAGVSSTSYDELRNSSLGLTRIARYSGGSNTTTMNITRDPSGQILSLRDSSSGARYYPLYDNQGSIVRIVNADGTVADSYSYDPYGVQTTNTNTYPQPFGYTGAYTNPATGLVHLGARYYDPTLGRFTSPDPQTHPGDINQSSPYTYAGDDPINHTDPTGLASFSISGSVCAFGGCLSASIGLDDDGDVNVKGGLGVGGGEDVSASYDPGGDYSEGNSYGIEASCSAGGVSANASVDSEGGGSLGGSFTTGAGASCSGGVYDSYTF